MGFPGDHHPQYDVVDRPTHLFFNTHDDTVTVTDADVDMMLILML